MTLWVKTRILWLTYLEGLAAWWTVLLQVLTHHHGHGMSEWGGFTWMIVWGGETEGYTGGYTTTGGKRNLQCSSSYHQAPPEPQKKWFTAIVTGLQVHAIRSIWVQDYEMLGHAPLALRQDRELLGRRTTATWNLKQHQTTRNKWMFQYVPSSAASLRSFT